jgi:phosphoribosylanthranilate isomerase
MLPIPIVASNISHLTDARYFAAWLVEWMSFPLDGPEAIRPQTAIQLAEWVEGPDLAARYEMTALDEIQEQWDTLPVQGLILSGQHYLSQLALHPVEQPYFLELPLNTRPDVIRQIDHFSPQGVILFAGDEPLTPKTFIPWSTCSCPIYLHVQKHNIEELWTLVEREIISGWAVSGAGEEKVGFKSFDAQDEIYEFLLDRETP